MYNEQCLLLKLHKFMSKSITIKQMQKQVEDFISERDWYNDNPNQLITSLLIELAELSEHYQWKSSFKKINKNITPSKKKEIGFEVVDVMVFLLRIANNTGINIGPLFEEKIQKLKIKYPDGSNPKQRQLAYRKSGKNKLY